MTTVSAHPGTLASDGDAFHARRFRPRPDRDTATEDPTTVDLRAYSEMVQALIDVARAPMDLSWRMKLVRRIVGPLPDHLALPFAEMLVLLGEDYEKAVALYSDTRDGTYRALYAHAAEGADKALFALRHRRPLRSTCIICGGSAAGIYCTTHAESSAVAS